MSLAERRHPDWFGLNTRPDSKGLFARIAQNCMLDVPGQLDRRPGYRRLNQMQYDGPVWAIIDIQRICDFAKLLVCSHLVFEHEEVYDGGGHGGGDLFISPNLAPHAVAAATPSAGLAPLNVQFSSAGSFDPEDGPLTYFWNFGDGNTSNAANPAHVYGAGGTYTVTLTVTDAQGASDSASVTIDMVHALVCTTAFGTRAVSQDGGVTWAAPAGIPAGGTSFACCVVSGFMFVFRINGNQVDVYRSPDKGSTWGLVGSVPAFSGTHMHALVVGTRILLPIREVGTGDRACACSDDNGATWTVVVLSLADHYAGQIVSLGGSVVAYVAQDNAGAGQPVEMHVSLNAGNTWGPVISVAWADSQMVPIVGASGTRLMMIGRAFLPGQPSQVRTSDDLGTSWQLRDTAPAQAISLTYHLGSGGGAAGYDMTLAPPRVSPDNGVSWVNIGALAGKISALWKLDSGWWASIKGSPNIYFGASPATLALKGTLPAGYQWGTQIAELVPGA